MSLVLKTFLFLKFSVPKSALFPHVRRERKESNSRLSCVSTHTTDTRVHFCAFFRQPFSKQLLQISLEAFVFGSSQFHFRLLDFVPRDVFCPIIARRNQSLRYNMRFITEVQAEKTESSRLLQIHDLLNPGSSTLTT